MSNDFLSVIDSIKAARTILTPVQSEEAKLPKWLGAPAEVKTTDDEVKVELSRNVKTDERRYLKENGFRSAEDGKTWVKEGASEQEGKALDELINIVDDTQPGGAVTTAMTEVLDRAMSKGSANEVFAAFSKDVAALKVAEAFNAIESSDRQRAQETILGYALGKPVERTISLHANIANMSKEELLDQIRQKLDSIGPQVGIPGAAGGHSLLLDGGGGAECSEPLERVQAECGVSGEVSQEPQEHPADHSR